MGVTTSTLSIDVSMRNSTPRWADQATVPSSNRTFTSPSEFDGYRYPDRTTTPFAHSDASRGFRGLRCMRRTNRLGATRMRTGNSRGWFRLAPIHVGVAKIFSINDGQLLVHRGRSLVGVREDYCHQANNGISRLWTTNVVPSELGIDTFVYRADPYVNYVHR